MAFSQRMEIKQGQSLVMTPQLQQAIKLLQFSNMEVAAFVEDELARNPFLERDTAAPAPEAQNGAGAQKTEKTEKTVAAKAEEAMDADFESTYATTRADASVSAPQETGGHIDWSRAGTGGRSGFENSSFGMDQLEADEATLVEHLQEQLCMTHMSDPDRMLAAQLISFVEDDGYIRVDLDEEATRLGVDPNDMERVLKTLQGFDPVGVCARDLPECLMLQLREKDRFDPAMQKLVEHLDLLANHDAAKLLEICEVDAEDLADMVAELRSLNPKPGDAFTPSDATPVVPDVFIRPTPEGGWAVELNSDNLPKVLVNSRYYSEVSQSLKKEEDKDFVSEAHATASWLVKSLDQRARTILKVARELVRQQDRFLAEGVQGLRPLNLKTVADAIEMHESTVSRVTANKYVATPRGLFELKYFFTVAIPSNNGGEGFSAEAIRHRIKGLVAEETPSAVLSDDRIVEILREAGVDIARRTVAKYREAMHIPSSVQRRRAMKQNVI